MNVINCSGQYQIYKDGVSVYRELPVGVYDVDFDKFSGFFLTSHDNFVINESKIYGKSDEKVEKVLSGFNRASRNFGVILSGIKGSGKSLFVKCLGIKANELGLPVIIVSKVIPNISKFISSISQEVVVVFDEFEKIFGESSDSDFDDYGCKEEPMNKKTAQVELLSLFDGLDCGKKLFVITCNNCRQLDSCLLNRPGRFHYHLKFKPLQPDEIREYLSDNLLDEYQMLIDSIMNLSVQIDLTYDILRAMVFDLNQGYSLGETLEDLNIDYSTNGIRVTLVAELMDGTEIRGDVFTLDLRRENGYTVWADYKQGEIGFIFKLSDIDVDVKNHRLHLRDLSNLKLHTTNIEGEVKPDFIKSVYFERLTISNYFRI